MSPELAKYLEECRAQGMKDQQIKDGLTAAGWQPEQIAAAFPVVVTPQAPTPQLVAPPPVLAETPPTHTVLEITPIGHLRKKSRTPLIAATILGVLILFSGTVAFAEHGYFPAFSKVYRHTLLPLVWKGTTGNAGLSLSQAVANTLNVRPLKAVTSVKMQLSLSNQAVSSVTATLPANGESKQLADVAQPEESKYDFSFTTSVDSTNQIATSVQISLPKDDPLRNAASGYLNPDFTTLSIDSMIPASGNAVYERSNATPSATIADARKWFKIPFGTEGINTIHQQQDKVVQDLTNNGDMRTALMNAVNGMTTDKGVVRHNNEAEAWYTSLITPAKAQELAKDTKLPETVRETFAELADGWKTGQITLDWYLTTHNPTLSELVITAQTTDTEGAFSGVVDVHVSYGGNVEKITIPESSETWSDPITYVESIQAAYPNLNSTGVFSTEGLASIMSIFAGPAETLEANPVAIQNQTRLEDVTTIAKAIEVYKVNNDDNVPGDTERKYVRLDSDTNPLCGAIDGVDCVFKDPLPDTYFYSYWTDGQSYRVVGVQVGENGEPNRYYIVEDGTSLGIVDTLP